VAAALQTSTLYRVGLYISSTVFRHSSTAELKANQWKETANEQNYVYMTEKETTYERAKPPHWSHEKSCDGSQAE